MSNTAKALEQPCQFKPGCSAIELVIEPKEKDLGEFSVRRSLPNSKRQTVGPWIFFDHMGPANFAAGSGINVRPHPHIGIATVTYLFEGEILHRDSLGNKQAIVPGDLNLMVCGRGIVHSERERDEVREQPHKLHGLQLWLVLPVEDEEVEPAFHHYPGHVLPTFEIAGVKGRVMMGSAYGLTSPVRTFSETLYVEASLRAGQHLQLPRSPELGLYLADGELKLGDTKLKQHSLAVLTDATEISVTAITDCRIAMIGGASEGRRSIEWNFVSSRPERIEQARRDWIEARFPVVPGDESERIAFPTR